MECYPTRSYSSKFPCMVKNFVIFVDYDEKVSAPGTKRRLMKIYCQSS